MPLDLTSARSDVVSFIGSLIDDVAADGHRDLLQLHLLESSSAIISDEIFCPVDLPLLTHGALSPTRPVPLAVIGACTLAYLGADLLDNVADCELSEAWIDAGPDAATLAAATYLSSLTYMALSRHAGPPEQRSELMSVCATVLCEMSAGQFGDLNNSAVDAGSSLTTTRLKAGAEFALFLQAGAIAAGAGSEEVERFAEIGSAVGTAVQLASDIHDTFRVDPSPDLRNGRTTLPVIHARSVLEGEELGELNTTLTACTVDDSRHEEARELLRVAGGLRYAALITEVHVQRATRLLRELDLPPGATNDLEDHINSISLLRASRPPSTVGAGNIAAAS